MTDSQHDDRPGHDGEARMTRRAMLLWASGAALAAPTSAAPSTAPVAGAQIPPGAESPAPRSSGPGPGPGRFRVGPVDAFPPGTRVAIDTRRVCIVHDGHGIAALSTSCTHLGCIAEQAADGFVCRCHGSRFDRDGRVTGEPARAPLAWFAVRRTADGDLEVDTSVEVAPGTYFAA